MFHNSKFYQKTKENYPQVSPDFSDALSLCATNYAFSSSWTIHAASNVIGCPIHTVYPLVNGLSDKYIPILNRTFVPRTPHRKKAEVTVMWSGSCGKNNGMWVPNHFVPLLDRAEAGNVIDMTDSDQFPPLPTRKIRLPNKPKTDTCPSGSPVLLQPKTEPSSPSPVAEISDTDESDSFSAKTVPPLSPISDNSESEITLSPEIPPLASRINQKLKTKVGNPSKYEKKLTPTKISKTVSTPNKDTDDLTPVSPATDASAHSRIFHTACGSCMEHAETMRNHREMHGSCCMWNHFHVTYM